MRSLPPRPPNLATWIASCLLATLGLVPGVQAQEPAFDGSREALTIPEAVWRRVLEGGGRPGGTIGYTADEMRAYGKDAHLLRNVQALFADVRKIPRETGRITSQLLEHAAKPSEVLARGYALCDVHAGRMYEPPKEGRWGMAAIDAIEAPETALRHFVKDPPAGLERYPPALLRLLVRVLVGQELAARWVALARYSAGDGFASQARQADSPAGLERRSQHRAHRGPWLDEEHGQTATFAHLPLDRIAAFDRARLAYASLLLAVHLERALDAWRAEPEEARVPGDVAFPLLLRSRDEATIVVHGPGADEALLPFDTQLSIDLGGNDRWSGSMGATWSMGPASAVHLDLGGDDRYEATGDAALACGMFGVGIVVDEGGDDAYEAQHSGMGCGFFGTGLLLDRAGDDVYRAREAWCQGSGHVGVGALVDLAGDDEYECAQQSQGLGGTLGAGLLVDVAGNDAYVARDDGNVSELYLGQSVAMSQGCGYGRRADLGDGASLAGGVGVLVDGAGDDRYHAQVWAQGCGYWWGLGILEDRGGDDAYQNGKYSAGAAAHFAIGVCVDLAGNDLHNAQNQGAKNQFQGHARDGSVGVFVDGAGDDGYDVNNNCAGSGDLGSIGLFWDRRGDDRYTFHPTDVEGEANGWNDTGAFGTATRYKPFHSFRDDLPTWGIFLDTGGKDTYANERPAKGWTPTPAADGATWVTHGGPLFFGLGYDVAEAAR
jgi:hypothetical protein